MVLLKRLPALWPFFAASWFSLFLFLANRNPKFLVSLLIFSLLLPAAMIFFYSFRLPSDFPRLIFWLPALPLFLALAVLLVFLDRPLLRQILIGGAFVLTYLIFYYFSLFRSSEAAHLKFLFKKINWNLFILTVFFSAASLFAWGIFIAHQLWPGLIAVFLLVTTLAFTVFYENLWTAGKIVPSGVWLFSVIVGILAAQFFWALNFWPVGFLTKGAIFAIITGYLVYLTKHFLLETFNRRRALKIFGLCLLLVVIILFLARWV